MSHDPICNEEIRPHSNKNFYDWLMLPNDARVFWFASALSSEE